MEQWNWEYLRECLAGAPEELDDNCPQWITISGLSFPVVRRLPPIVGNDNKALPRVQDTLVNFTERWWSASGPEDTKTSREPPFNAKKGDIFILLNSDEACSVIKIFLLRSPPLNAVLEPNINLFTYNEIGHLYCDKVGVSATFYYRGRLMIRRPDARCLRIYMPY